jgi:Lipoate-protein ligase A
VGRAVQVAELFVLTCSTDPSFNLELEERMFELAERKELPYTVRFWVNRTCLVKGKTKSEKYGWYDERLANELGIRVYERSTGGGVVYHDLGNLNWSVYAALDKWSFLSPVRVFEEHSRFIVEALSQLGYSVRFAPPNRLELEGHKVSGMAARSSVRALLVHGTLLVNADLRALNELCVPPPSSPKVENLCRWRPTDHTEIVLSVLKRNPKKIWVIPSYDNFSPFVIERFEGYDLRFIRNL